MNADVRQKVAELAAALSETDEFRRFREAQQELENHAAAKIMLRDFAERRRELEARAANGEEPSEDEMRRFEQQAQAVSVNPYLRPVLESEYAVSQLVAEVQAALLVGLGIVSPEQLEGGEESGGDGTGNGGASGSGDVPAGERRADGSAAPGREGRPDRAKSRLWTPGSGIDPGLPKL